MREQTEKLCSICGKLFEITEFDYGNRTNRSYCKECDKAEKSAYAAGGKEGAAKFRDEMRAKWKIDV